MANLLDQASGALLDQAGVGLYDQGGSSVPVAAGAYPIQVAPDVGLLLGFAQPGGTSGDQAPTGACLGLLVSNAGTAPVTVLLPVVPTYDGLMIATRTFVVPASNIGLIPLPSSVYGMRDTQVGYTEISSVTIAVIGIP